MTLRGFSFVLRVCLQSVLDYLFGISCASCGAHVRLPVPAAWRWETSWDGRARWRCGDCLAYHYGNEWVH